MSDRPKGVVVYRSPKNPTADAAKEHERQREQTRQEAAAARAARPVPNYICYPDAFKGRVDENGNWLGGKLPKCRVCGGILPPQENHKCGGFMPKYSDVPPEERMAMRRGAWLTDGGDWDDDHFDPTTPEGVTPRCQRDPDEEDSGTPFLDWDEDDWIAWKNHQLSRRADYDASLEYDEDYRREDECHLGIEQGYGEE